MSELPASAPIVGMHFRPPAKLIIGELPSGQALILRPEPENKYDSKAVMVLVDLSPLPESFWDEVEPMLVATGADKEELCEAPFQLGYIDKAKTGKAALIFDAMAEGRTPTATLGFNPAGAAEANILWSEGAASGFADPEDDPEAPVAWLGDL